MVEFDRLRYELRCSVLCGTAATVIIAISSHHHDRQIRMALFDFGQQFQAIHAGHVYVGKDGQQLGFDFAR